MKKKINKNKSFKLVYGLIFFLITILCIPNIYIFKYLINKNHIIAKDSENLTTDFTIVSYNIRCWTFMDIGKKSWFYRADLILSNLKLLEPDIIGFQEVTSGQYTYLKNKMENYNSIIEYRDNMPWSEGCPIFYNENRYELIDTSTFWLSETPEKVSKAWNAADYRICSYVILFDRKTESKLVVFNTHLDYKDEETREKEMAVICEKVKLFDDTPIILLGDFNTIEVSETYKYVADYLDNSRHIATNCVSDNTYQNWGNKNNSSLIDYIMLSPQYYNVKRYYIGEEAIKGLYGSDHSPVCVQLELATNK